ncbi:MAG: hypothetical protein DRJ52_03185 [Thermoprotei archaeon]|nr:MAG: hypothetical protein DRJ52_03185 [Thermoprotei archaeon]HDI75243.1 hypothetical protein [Thermoprotei archaeon]
MNKISFGISVLDSILKEGYPKQSLVLLVGEGGIGKSVFLMLIAKHRLELGEPVLFVCLDNDPLAIIESFKSFGFEVDKYTEKNLLGFIDCYSFKVSAIYRKNLSYVLGIADPKNLNQLAKTIVEAMSRLSVGKGGCLLLDSLNEIFLYNDLTRVSDFLKEVRYIVIRHYGASFFATIHVGLSKWEELRSMIEHLADGVIEFRFEPSLSEAGVSVRQVRVKKMRAVPHDSNWYSFHITKEGIVPLKVKIRVSGEIQEKRDDDKS